MASAELPTRRPLATATATGREVGAPRASTGAPHCPRRREPRACRRCVRDHALVLRSAEAGARVILGWPVLASGLRLGVGAGRQATRPVRMAVELGQRAGSRMAVASLDALLGSALAEVAT